MTQERQTRVWQWIAATLATLLMAGLGIFVAGVFAPYVTHDELDRKVTNLVTQNEFNRVISRLQAIDGKIDHLIEVAVTTRNGGTK